MSQVSVIVKAVVASTCANTVVMYGVIHHLEKIHHKLFKNSLKKKHIPQKVNFTMRYPPPQPLI